jgi:sugar phosphate isomerase/epimerase
VKLSIFTASTPDWTPAEAAQILAAQGWDGIEWRVTDQEDAPEPGFWAGNRCTWPMTGLEDRLPEIAEVTRAAGLEFSGIGGYARAYDRPNVERLLGATSVLGAGRVRVNMPLLEQGTYRELFAKTRDDLDWATERAAHHGVKILVELHHRTIAASASSAVRLLDSFDPEHIGVIHDVGNLVYEGHEDYRAAFDMLGPYLAHAHVKNVAWAPVEQLAGGVTRWQADWATMREGQADIAGYLRALREHGYDGWVTSEDFSTKLPLEQRCADNLAFLRSLLEPVAA